MEISMTKGTLNLLKSNSKADIEGVWFQYQDHDIHLLIARMGNREYEKFTTKELTKRKGIGSTSVEKIMERTLDSQPEAVANTILLDWKGVNDNGKNIPYTPELGLEYFRNPDFHWFYKYVLSCSNEVERFEAKVQEDQQGNSESVSSGISSSGRKSNSSRHKKNTAAE